MMNPTISPVTAANDIATAEISFMFPIVLCCWGYTKSKTPSMVVFIASKLMTNPI